jgi:hypothetical protein
MPKLSELPKLALSIIRPNIIFLSLVGSATIILAWVGSLIWTDLTVWGKDIGAIFFGSRTGEAISLGIGMTVIHYFSLGMFLLAAGLALFLRNRFFAAEPYTPMIVMNSEKPALKRQTRNAKVDVNISSETVEPPVKEENAAAREERFFSGCLHHFGYLSSRPKDSPIPQECIICQRLGDCMVATIYVEKTSE